MGYRPLITPPLLAFTALGIDNLPAGNVGGHDQHLVHSGDSGDGGTIPNSGGSPALLLTLREPSATQPGGMGALALLHHRR